LYINISIYTDPILDLELAAAEDLEGVELTRWRESIKKQEADHTISTLDYLCILSSRIDGLGLAVVCESGLFVQPNNRCPLTAEAMYLWQQTSGSRVRIKPGFKLEKTTVGQGVQSTF
jgi:hypothetical protein